MCSCPGTGNTPATSTLCPIDNWPKCVACSDLGGYYLRSYKCLEKKCFCSNGQDAVGAGCKTHNTENCGSCNVLGGYELEFIDANVGRCVNPGNSPNGPLAPAFTSITAEYRSVENIPRQKSVTITSNLFTVNVTG